MDNDTLAELLVKKMIAKELTLATAESCTGGLIGHTITNISGASDVFVGGVIAYSNEVKMSLLGVSGDTLDSVGAVSEDVARQMAVGARDCFRADIAVGVTGIAGPSGGTVEKPLGLVYVGVAWSGGCDVMRNVFPGSRLEVKQATVTQALEMILERV